MNGKKKTQAPQPSIDEQIQALMDGEQRARNLYMAGDPQALPMLQQLQAERQRLQNEKARQEAERQREAYETQMQAQRQQMFQQMNYNPGNMNADPSMAQFTHQRPMPMAAAQVPSAPQQPTALQPSPQLAAANPYAPPKPKESYFSGLDKWTTLIQIGVSVGLFIVAILFLLFK
jgi:hypothetical protein